MAGATWLKWPPITRKRVAPYGRYLTLPPGPGPLPLFRRLLFTALEAAFEAGELHFFASREALCDRRAFLQHLAPARQVEWVVYAKPPFAGPQQVLDYVGRYTHRIAIADARLVDINNGQVTFRYKNYRDDRPTPKTMMLPAAEFLRRFLLHVLPAGFHRIRYYGFLAHRHRAAKLARGRQLLGTPAPAPSASTRPADYRDRYEVLTGRSLWVCPVCHDGQMLLVEHLASASATIPITDSS